MWTVSKKPFNYSSPDSKEWCIIDQDGDIHDFYFTEEEAQKALIILLAERSTFFQYRNHHSD